MPKVSVIIPVYNVELYLRQCLDSVVNQTLKDIEIICVNDGSTDNSLEILKEYASKDARIKIIDKPNSGYGHSMNTGIDSATGEYLGIVEPDDYIELNMYETLYNKAKEFDLDFIKGNYYRYSDTPNITNEFCETFNKIEIYEKVINPNNYVKTFRGALSIWASIYKIEFLKQNKIRFLETPGASFQDTSFGIKTIFSAQKVMYLENAFYHYRTNNTNSSVKSNNKIFCVCDEIHELENRYASDPEKMLIVNALKIDKYTWNYNRLDQIGREKFIKTYKKEIKKIFNEERYNQEFLLSGIKDSCSRILNNTEKTSMSFIEKIFSIKNSYDKRHKIITIFGIKIKLRKNNLLKNIFTVENIDIYKILTISCKKFKFIKPLKKQERAILKQYINQNIKDNTVLLIEPNNYHGEVLPGIAKYFIDLGFHTDVIITESEYKLGLFDNFNNAKTDVYHMPAHIMWHFFKTDYIKAYKYIYINTEYIGDPITKKLIPISNYLELEKFKDKLILMNHRPGTFRNNSYRNLLIANLPITNSDKYKVVNSHYFGDIAITGKNDITNFIVIGNIEDKRKNHNLLLDSVGELLQQGITNFKITVIARTGTLNSIPENIRPFIDFKGRLDYQQMYKELEKADFFLALLDPDNPEHDRYITTGTSGSFQLIYGFAKPCLINKKFATLHGFNDENSIIYEKNSDFTEVLKKAIDMPANDYNMMQNSLKNYSDSLYQTSIKNLKEILEYKE